MNTYRYTFIAACPGNGEQIIYALELNSAEKVLVEHIKTACALHQQGYQEDIAADLHARFGGRLTLRAVHHGVDIETVLAAPAQAQEDAQDAVRALIATHAEMLEDNAYAYFELAYTRQTGWMAWITDKPLYGAPIVNPDRKVLAQGQGDTPDEACADAARAAQGGA